MSSNVLYNSSLHPQLSPNIELARVGTSKNLGMHVHNAANSTQVLQSITQALSDIKCEFLKSGSDEVKSLKGLVKKAEKDMAFHASPRIKALMTKDPSSVPKEIKQAFQNIEKNHEQAYKLKAYLDLRDNLIFWQAMGADLQLGKCPSLNELIAVNKKIDKENLDQNKKSFDLENLNLTSIPTDLFLYKNIKDLNLTGNLITQIPESLGDLNKLKSLSLNNNRITSIPECLRRLVQLQFLELNRNFIKEIPDWIGELQNLEGLDLQYNRIEKIPESCTKLPNLQRFYYGYNPLEEIPDFAPDLKPIPDPLDIFDAKHLPDTCKRVKSLLADSPYCLSDEIKKLYEEIKEDKDPTKAKKLRVFLDVRDNVILWDKLGSSAYYSSSDTLDSLQKKYQNIDKMEVREKHKERQNFTLNKLKLTSIPSDLLIYFNIETLNLSNNLITRIPDSLKNHKNLESLNLSCNKIEEIPNSLGQCEALASLDLALNKFQEIPDSVSKLKSLVNLNLNHNKIKTIPNHLNNLSELQTLSLAHNPIESLADLHLMVKLTRLNLNYCGLTEIPVWLKKLVNMKGLSVNGNKIKKLPYFLGELEKLKSVGCYNNCIEEVPANLKNKISLFDLGGNPIKRNNLPTANRNQPSERRPAQASERKQAQEGGGWGCVVS